MAFPGVVDAAAEALGSLMSSEVVLETLAAAVEATVAEETSVGGGVAVGFWEAAPEAAAAGRSAVEAVAAAVSLLLLVLLALLWNFRV